MKKSVKKLISLMLVLAVLVTSMLVSGVSADTATPGPMQTVLLKALHLTEDQKRAFNTTLNTAETDIPAAVSSMQSLFSEISEDDATDALEKYKSLTSDQKSNIQIAVLAFDLNEIPNISSLGFSTIVGKVNTELTGSASNNDGINLLVQVIKYLNYVSKNGAYVTDKTSDTTKISFVYNSSDPLVAMAKSSVNDLIGVMETIKAKVTGKTGATAFDKLLNYTADVINTAPNTEIAALKTYLNSINDSYYQPYVPTSSGSTGSTGSTTPVNNTGTVSVGATVTGPTAKVTADQIKIADVTAAADAVIAKAAEAAKKGEKFEKKLSLEFDVKGAANVDLALPGDLFTKVKEKGLEKIEIKAGDAQIAVAPDFTADLKDAKSVNFKVNKVSVTDDMKAKLSDEQKKLIAGNETIFNFDAAVVAADGKEKKLTSFDKALTIKLKYELKAGEDKDKITVLYLAADGTIQNMVGRYDETTKEVIFETKHFSTYMVKNVVVSFNDVKANAWYKKQAESLAAKGIVGGRGGNNFAPDANVTRAEFMVMLVKAMGAYDETATCSFTDVSKDAWYYTYVASAVKAGITSGIGNNKFGPNDNITRQDMAVMLVNALGDKTIDNADKYLTASDANTISAYAKNAVALCVKNEFMVGSGDKLTPKATSTRAMAASVVYKFFNFIY